MGTPNLDIRQKIVDEGGFPSLPFHMWWQSFINAQNGVNDTLQDQIDAITGLGGSVTDALAAAENLDIAVSGTTSCTLTGKDDGSTAKIVVSGHQRLYGSGNIVSVSGSTILNLSHSTTYYVYYDQDDKTGGNVLYKTTTSPTIAAQVGVRHLVGKVTTPAALAADTTGLVVQPPGINSLA